MKIESIRIRNLASLAGTQEPIRFGINGLDGGLVAITGATGSGKSTIIDAVCLALYGTTPRLKNTPSDDKDGKHVENLISRGASDAFAEVEFQDGSGRQLRARWSMTISNTGTSSPPQMTLISKDNGEALATGKKAVTLEVTQSTGLDFEQFNGVVTLSQGSFSSFLKGKKDDRSKLLERLTGTEIYGKLSKAAQKDAARKAAAVREQERMIGEVDILTEEDRRVTEKRRQELDTERSSIAKELNIALQEHQNLCDLQQVEKDHTAAQHKLTECELEQQNSQHDIERLRRSRRIEPLRIPFDRAHRNEKALAQAVSEVTQAKNKEADALSHATALRLTWIEYVKDVRGNIDRLNEELQTRSHHAFAEPSRCTEIEAKRQAVEEDLLAIKIINGRLPELLKQLNENKELFNAKTEAVKLAEEKLLHAKTQWSEAKAHQISIIEKHGDQARVASQATTLQHIQDHVQQKSATTIQRDQANERLKLAFSQVEAAKRHLETQLLVLNERQSAMDDAKTSHEALMRVASLADHRHSLIVGEDCPLCGHSVHSIPDQLPESEVRSAAERFQAAKQRLKEAESNERQASKDLTHKEASRDQITQEVEHLQKQLNVLDQRLDADLSKLGLAKDGSESLEVRLEQFQNVLSETMMTLESSAKKVTDTEIFLEQANQKSNSLKESLTLAQLKMTKVESEHNSHLQQRESRNLDLSGHRQSYEESMSTLAKKGGLDQPSFEEAPSWLKERTSQYQLWQQLQSTHQKVMTVWEGIYTEIQSRCGPEIDLSPKAISTYTQATIDQAFSLEKQANNKDRESHDTLRSAQQSTSNAIKTQSDLEAEKEIIESRITELMKSADVENQTTARSWLLSEEESRQIEARIKTMEQNLAITKSNILTLCKRKDELLQILAEKAPQDSTLLSEIIVQVTSEIEVIKNRQEQTHLELGNIAGRLKKDDEQRLKISVHQEFLDRLRSDHATAEKLRGLIGHSNGDTFREYAQTLTLEQLVHYANHRLKNFKPRYSLATRSGLQLDVLDHEQADEVRPTSTLSGGESFLVSLALALGLADFRRGTGSIKSVFIDEGFGSLDGDSLEAALATLENVQSELDAQVIVISHVGELQERWQDHIQVRGLGHGRSWLVLPNGPDAPPSDQGGIGIDYQIAIDTDQIETFLITQGEKQTRQKIAEALGLENDHTLAKALKQDERFVLEGKSWTLV